MVAGLATRPGTVEGASCAPPVDQDELRTLVTISRTHPRDIGTRQVFARLDDCPSVPLVFGDALTIETRPGHHRLRIHNTLFWRTIDFTVETGEHLEFIVINWASWFTLTTAMWLGTGLIYLRVERRSRV
jgi:hypothetical protein